MAGIRMTERSLLIAVIIPSQFSSTPRVSFWLVDSTTGVLTPWLLIGQFNHFITNTSQYTQSTTGTRKWRCNDLLGHRCQVIDPHTRFAETTCTMHTLFFLSSRVVFFTAFFTYFVLVFSLPFSSLSSSFLPNSLSSLLLFWLRILSLYFVFILSYFFSSDFGLFTPSLPTSDSSPPFFLIRFLLFRLHPFLCLLHLFLLSFTSSLLSFSSLLLAFSHCSTLLYDITLKTMLTSLVEPYNITIIQRFHEKT